MSDFRGLDHADFTQAKQDYDNFQQESAARDGDDARTKWELSEDEQQDDVLKCAHFPVLVIPSDADVPEPK